MAKGKGLFGGVNLKDVAAQVRDRGEASPLERSPAQPTLAAAEMALSGRSMPAMEREVILAVDPKRCRPWKFHNRTEAWYTRERCQDLIDSIARDGQLEPALVRRIQGEKDYDFELIFGMRRRFACEATGQKLKVRVLEAPDARAAVLMHIENADRQDITPMERAISFQLQVAARQARTKVRIGFPRLRRPRRAIQGCVPVFHWAAVRSQGITAPNLAARFREVQKQRPRPTATRPSAVVFITAYVTCSICYMSSARRSTQSLESALRIRPAETSTRGITSLDVDRAADALLREGSRPTVERVRAALGRGSPNTINPLLDAWWKRLSGRLDAGPAALHRLPEPVLLAAEGLWMTALDDARRRAAVEQGSRKASLTKDRQDLEIRSHVLSIRESEITSRLQQSESRVTRLEIEIESLLTLLRKEQASRTAAERRLQELQESAAVRRGRAPQPTARASTATKRAHKRRKPARKSPTGRKATASRTHNRTKP